MLSELNFDADPTRNYKYVYPNRLLLNSLQFLYVIHQIPFNSNPNHHQYKLSAQIIRSKVAKNSEFIDCQQAPQPPILAEDLSGGTCGVG